MLAGRTVASYWRRTDSGVRPRSVDVALEAAFEAELVGRIDVDAQLVVGQQLGEMEGEDAFDEEKGAGGDGFGCRPGTRVWVAKS